MVINKVGFKEISIEDKQWVSDALNKSDYMGCEYSFGNNFIWKNSHKVEIANIDGFYIASTKKDDLVSFMYPTGSGDIKEVIQTLMDYCEENNYIFKMHSVLEDAKEQLENLFPDKFIFTEKRDNADYIYKSEDLINLQGKKYHGKRNHIKRFKDNNWSFEPITQDNIEDCIAMNKKWCIINGCADDDSKKEEICAVRRSFRHFEELGFFGGLLRVDENVVAYTIGERLNSNTIVVHIEKAFSDIQGAYPAINQEFIKNMASEYEYVNREDDLGIEGLRKAKLSYNPVILLTKYGVTLK